MCVCHSGALHVFRLRPGREIAGHSAMMDSNWVAGTRYIAVMFGSRSMTVDLPSQASEAKIVHLRRDGVSSLQLYELML